MLSLNAGNDTNGNPRRLYVLIRDGHIAGAWNEGYQGWGAVPKALQSLAQRAITVATTPGQYRSLLRRFKAGDI
jgi:hypothetical protein